MAANKTIRIRLTVKQKLAICGYARKSRAQGSELSYADLARWATETFKLRKPLSRDTARRVVEREAQWTAVPVTQLSRKTILNERHRVSDALIMTEVVEMEGEFESTTVDVVREIAVETKAYGEPCQLKLSNGWAYKFQKRNGLSVKRKHGEALSVDPKDAQDGRVKMRKLTDPYARSDICNMDDTAFFFRQESKTTLAQKKAVSGRKDPKNRVTLALAVNADGSDKLPPLYIGSAAEPRALKGHDVRLELGVDYKNSTKAGMNASIFLSWLGDLNHRMWCKDRKILLLVDNVSSHVRPAVPMSNVRLEYLPKNTTSCLQPLDQGIIRATKSKYTKLKVMDSVKRYFAKRRQEKVDIYTAMRWSKMAFDDVSQETIQNC